MEIEEVLRTHPQISDCAVVGIPDPEWGELVVACLVPSDEEIALDTLKPWLKRAWPGYKIPRKYLLVKELPRNALGKVTKPTIKDLFTKKYKIP